MSSLRQMWLLGLAFWLLSCGGAATEHETLGDRAYAALQYDDALVEYRLALVQRAEDPGTLREDARQDHVPDYVTRQGGTVVLAAGTEFTKLALNEFDDDSVFNATPVISSGQLLLRSDRFLYCIGK